MTTIIHVNRAHIAMNAKDGGDRPVFTAKRGSGPARYANQVEILGPSRMVRGQLPCGAKAWIETEAEVRLIGECSFAEAREAA